MKHIKYLLLILLIIIITGGCKKDEPIENQEKLVDFFYDYEDIDDEDNGLMLGSGEMIILPDTITEKSARATIIRRGDYIWQSAERTKYVHYKDKVIDYTNGIYKYDCSGFVYSIILSDSLPEHANDLNNQKGILHPEDYSVRAWTFYDYYRDSILKDATSADNQYWKVFMSVDSLKKGDLIIVRYDDNWRKDWVEEGNHASTGHVMIAWDIGTVNQNNEVNIKVFDCSSSGHTKSSDTRYCNSVPVAEINEDSEKPSGIGFGWMTYKISTNGHRRPYAYKWSLNSTYWYNLRSGDEINEPGIKFDRIEGIIFARPI